MRFNTKTHRNKILLYLIGDAIRVRRIVDEVEEAANLQEEYLS